MRWGSEKFLKEIEIPYFMTTLQVHTDPNHRFYQKFRQVAGVYHPGEQVVLEIKPRQYCLWFDFGTAHGTFTIRADALAVMVLNDEPTEKVADVIDLAGLVDAIEEDHVIGGTNVAEFLQKCQGLTGDQYLQMQEGILFGTDYPLEYAAPGLPLRRILESRGKRYKWREELWELVGEHIEVVSFAPQR